MKLFDLNIGIKIDNNKQVAELIKQDKYDIVTLQESSRCLDGKSSRFNAANEIQKLLGHENSFFGGLFVSRHIFKNNKLHYDFGGLIEQGNQILTKHKFISAQNIFYYKHYSIYEDATNFKVDDQPRCFIDAVIEIGGKPLQVINVHGCWNQGNLGNGRTSVQTKAILAAVRQDIPSIVVGDFNLLPQAKDLKPLNKNLTNLISKYHIKSTRPHFDDGLDTGGVVCDYVFVNDLVKVNDFKVIASEISDHYPLILDFDI